MIPNNKALSKLPCKSRNGVQRQLAVGRQVMMQFCPTRRSWNQFFGIYFLSTCAAHLLDFFSTVPDTTPRSPTPYSFQFRNRFSVETQKEICKLSSARNVSSQLLAGSSQTLHTVCEVWELPGTAFLHSKHSAGPWR